LTGREIRRLSHLLHAAGIQPLEAVGPDPEIQGAAIDSRRVEPGSVFFAVRGLRQDGERFVPDAVRRGARAIVAGGARPETLDPEVAWVRVERPRRAAALLSRQYWECPDESLTLVGITGTNGKTTVAYLVEAIAAAAGRRAGRIGTLGHAFAGAERAAERTTPEAPEFYRLLAAMRDESIEIVAMEVSSHALALSRVDGARFATAAFLNLSRDHLDFHGDEDSYFRAKARLFESLGPEQHAVLPADSEHGERLRRMTRARVWTFGRGESADVRLHDERSGREGSSAVLSTPAGSLPVRSFLLGRFNLDNVAAAAACALSMGLPPESIGGGVLALESVPGRAERIDRGQPFLVLVDYAHTPEALRALLEWTRELADGRLFVLFGCGGERDAGKRAEMGRVAATRADRIFLTSDNPRGEEPQAILSEIDAGVAAVPGAHERTTILADRRQAIRAALDEAGPGDVVLLAGKGHETTQTIGDRVEPFDDRVVAAEVLDELQRSGGRRAGA
jgi:UDP-N-acetylmuramoyl-L-alanyl-D-glutamate--2,6-diaminopimelate ligase